ncbi:MAG: TonB family protein [Candidatus Sulfotelmatobacter sp.]
MPLTQIPFQDPVAPPEKPQPEQLGLYDAQEWETAYRDLDDDARVPHLLIQLQDDLARSRRREAVWISIIVHIVLIFFLLKIEWLEKYLPWHSVVVKNSTNVKDLTFLELPPDLQKVPHKPNTNIIGDKNRIAMTRHPELNVKELRKILASPPPGASGLNGPQMAQQAPAQPSAGLTQNQPASQPQQPPNPQIAQLQTPPKPDIKSEFSKYGRSMSAGEQIQEAARAARRGGGQKGDGGDLGLGTAAHGRQVGNLEILSDTMGVDFGPYLQRVLHDVKQNWYDAIPESAAMKHGNLIIEFAITKDGRVAGMKLVASSGDVPLDRAAWAGITGSDPFPALPSEFGGQYLALRFRFYYNPTKEEREGLE